MLTRLTTAAVRGVLIAVMILTPSLFVPSIAPDTAEIVALIALFAAGLTTIEYASSYPSIVEFRDAPPFNRIRYLSLLISILLISALCRDPAEAGLATAAVQVLGGLVGHVIDFPYSPVRLMVDLVATQSTPQDLDLIRAAAGVSYLISLLSLALFVVVLRFAGWPRGLAGFNVWINLPTFDPTAGADVVDRLNRDARINLMLGLLLPFLVPVVVRAGSILFEPIDLTSPHTLVWVMSAWAFLPASLVMRGVAMARVADMIAERRRRNGVAGLGLVPA